MTSSRFHPLPNSNPNSRFANLAAALRSGLTENDDARFSAYAEQQAGRRGSNHGPTTAMLQVLGELVGKEQRPAGAVAQTAAVTAEPNPASTTTPSPKAQRSGYVAPPPKLMPVPSHIEAMGPAAVQGYRQSFREANARSLRLLSHPAARGRGISLGQLIAQDLDDAEIVARLPQEASDDEQRAKMRQAEISAMWDRAFARASGRPVPTSFSSAESGEVWAKAIAANYPGHQPSGASSNSSNDVWDRVHNRFWPKK
ncbi:hypothetical protein [Sphingobium tyrosinilyticum]|uniref:Uncharacterized protein n=1 Tax=Sphingobium tyrosinilyticum TaxID=2715436 RepID=A0ABV9EXH0_9SPHN